MESNQDNKNNDLKDAFRQMTKEEWNDKKDMNSKRVNINTMGCFWAALITVIIMILLYIFIMDKLGWIN